MICNPRKVGESNCWLRREEKRGRKRMGENSGWSFLWGLDGVYMGDRFYILETVI